MLKENTVQYFGLGKQIVSLFLYTATSGDMAIQSCEHHTLQSHGHVNEGFNAGHDTVHI